MKFAAETGDSYKPHEECGVFGIYSPDGTVQPAYACYNGLLALQHRGQESCGIASNNQGVISYSKDMGLVTEAFTPEILEQLEAERRELGQVINEFLGTLNQESRKIFMRRYWYADSIAEIAQRYGLGESKVKTRLFRARNDLRSFLEKEGYTR